MPYPGSGKKGKKSKTPEPEPEPEVPAEPPGTPPPAPGTELYEYVDQLLEQVSHTLTLREELAPGFHCFDTTG